MAKADSTSLSVSANDRKKESELEFIHEGGGFRALLMRLCTRMCMDVEVAED